MEDKILLTGWGGQVRKAIAEEMETALATYAHNGKQPFDAGFYVGLKRAVEILDATKVQREKAEQIQRAGK